MRGGRGDFIVRAGESVVWDKQQMGGFPDEGEVVEDLKDLAAGD